KKFAYPLRFNKRIICSSFSIRSRIFMSRFLEIIDVFPASRSLDILTISGIGSVLFVGRFVNSKRLYTLTSLLAYDSKLGVADPNINGQLKYSARHFATSLA